LISFLHQTLTVPYLILPPRVLGRETSELFHSVHLKPQTISHHFATSPHYYKLFTDQGHASAQFNYAPLLDKGDRIAMNKALAAHSSKLSVDQGTTLVQARYDSILEELGDLDAP
jgi:TPR repeat protein